MSNEKKNNGKKNPLALPTVTREQINEGHRIWMDELRRNPNNFSFWFPHVKDLKVQKLMIPESVVIDCPEEVAISFFMEKDGDSRRIDSWIADEVAPVIRKVFPSGEVFIKNGCFSDKFAFDRACHVRDASDIKQLTSHIFRIQNDSLCLETYGNLELVVREYIPATAGTPAIYEGMPLRPEIRVFYDFDYRQYLYAVNYWDWIESHDHICRHPGNAAVYQSCYKDLSHRTVILLARHMDVVCRTLDSVSGLTGIWSADFILEDDRVWLIDMAQGTYWDAGRIVEMFPERYRVNG